VATHNFDTTINPGDAGQATWASGVSVALNNNLGNVPVIMGTSTPSDATYIFFKTNPATGIVELWIEDGT